MLAFTVISLPLLLSFASLSGLKKIILNWQTFFSFCSKTINFFLGFVFYYQNFWLILIVAGFIFFLFKGFIFLVVQSIKLRRLKKIMSQSLSKNIFGYRGYQVVEDSRAYAFTAGLLKPVTYISSGLLKKFSYQELLAVVAHEDYHRVNLHPLNLLLINVIRAFFSFLPFMNSVVNFFSQQFEYQADLAALKVVDKSVLASALIKVLAGDNSIPVPVSVATFSAKNRIDHLTSDRVPYLSFSKFWFIISVTFFVTALIFTLRPTTSLAKSGSFTRGNNYYCYGSGESIMSLVSFGQSEALMTINYSDH